MMKFLFFIICLFVCFNCTYAQICVGEAGQVKWKCWQNLFDHELGELYAEESYPLNPDFSITLYKLQSPINFDNLMGAKIAGYISVPASDTVVFNVTGDDVTRFYLSSDDSPTNLSLEAYTDNYTNLEEHDKYPEQTSDSIYLLSGQYYYFEMIYVEGGGGDHMSLWWKTDNDSPTEWRLVNNNFINGVDCLPSSCPQRNTPCDDGDSTTSDDMEDGFCNCVGKKDTSNPCIGERFKIKSYGYDSIPGGALNDLYTNPDFPAMPDRGITLHYLAEKYQNTIDSTGYLIQAYLTVPVTGNYKFNITGNNDCIFFISSDEDPANKQAHQILVTGSTDPTEHDKYIYQTTGPLMLEKDKYYYVELNHKEGSYTEHYSVFWQTPFTQSNTWKRIPEFYLFDYACTLACIPQGVPCDDGDAFTNNDAYDGNCDCVGIPCSGTDCNDPLASYSAFAKCDLTDQIDNRADNNWLSCGTTTNPNNARPVSHWIKYNFGQKFIMYTSHIWNYNENGNTDQGFETVAIDYSLDGAAWTELGVYNWNLADGSSDYSGFAGPDFGGIDARYVLITCLDDPAIIPCRGFGKLLINAEYCPNLGQPCDDGNPSTIYDVINSDCICEGVTNLFNDCISDTLNLGDTLIVMDTFSARDLITSSNTIGGNQLVMFVSGKEVDLEGGFDTNIGSNFEAFIELCNNSSSDQEEEENDFIAKAKEPEDFLRVSAIPETDIQIIEFHISSPGRVKLYVNDKSGKNLYTIIDADYINKGTYQKRLRTKKLEEGVYQILLDKDSKQDLEKMTVVK